MLLTSKKHRINGSTMHSFVIQNMVVTIKYCITLIYPEGIIYPSIYWNMAYNNCYITSCIYYPLVTKSIQIHFFPLVKSHIQTRLTTED